MTVFFTAIGWAIILVVLACNGSLSLRAGVGLAAFAHFLLLSLREQPVAARLLQGSFWLFWLASILFAALIGVQYFLFGQSAIETGNYGIIIVAALYEFLLIGRAIGHAIQKSVSALNAILAILALSLLTPFLYVASLGDEVLHELSAQGRVDAVKYLVKIGYDIDTVNEFGCTPLLTAIHRSQDQETLSALIGLGAMLDFADDRCGPALYDAVAEQKIDIVKLLLANGADANQTGPGGLTPLLVAARKSDPQIVYELLMAGADPEAEDQDGNTALHLVLLGDVLTATDCRLSLVDQVVNIAQNLINKGADPKWPNKADQNFQQMAKEFCDGDVLKKLE